MNIFKFCGKDKREAIKKAISFFYDNFEDEKLQVFLAKCRMQKDGTTLIYYHDWNVDEKALQAITQKRKENAKK